MSSNDDLATYITTGGNSDESDGQSLGAKGWTSSSAINIDPEAPEQGVCALLPTSGAGNSLLTGGLWQNTDAQSLLSAGILNASSFTQTQTDCLLGVIHTSHGPLTKGWGSAELAGPSDVEVIVAEPGSNSAGSYREVLDVEPTQGLIILKNAVLPGSKVSISYFYTKNPTIPFGEFNNEGFTFNQAGVASNYQKYPFTSVFQGESNSNVQQPLEIGHTYTAFQRGYTAVFNDPTTFLFNEPAHSPGLPYLGRNLEEFSASFESSNRSFPQAPWFLVEPPAPQDPSFDDNEDGLFLIEDLSSSQNVIDSRSLFYQQDVDINFDHVATINFRLKIYDYQIKGDFTGVSVGYADDKNLYSLGFLEVDNFTFAGFLVDEEEDSWSSYRGLNAIVDPEAQGSNDLVRLLDPPPFQEETSVFIEGDVYEVVSITTASSNNNSNTYFYDILLDNPLPSSGGFSSGSGVELFPHLDFTEVTSYRLFKDEEGWLQLFVSGSASPLAKTNEDEMAISPDLFEIMEYNQVYFGAISRQGESKSGWNFIRYNVSPTTPSESTENIVVRSDFDVLPNKQTEGRWTLVDDQGYADILTGDKLLLEQAGRPEEGSFSYARIEPLLTSSVTADLQTKLRVDSFSTGNAASVTISDERKEVTVALFAEDVTSDPADFSTYKVTGGQAELVDPLSISSGGAIPPSASFSQDTPVPRFRASYSGTKSFEDEGWVSNFDDVESTFIDRWHRIQKGSGLEGDANISVPLIDDEPFERYLFSIRFRIREVSLDSNGISALTFGAQDDLSYISLALYENGSNRKIVFTDDNNVPITDVFGDPLGVSFDWANASGFHTYRLMRTTAGLLFFIDGRHEGTFDPVNLPQGQGTGNYDLFLNLGQPNIELDLNYFFAHSLDHGPQKVGLWMGGPINDPLSYEFVNQQWIGSDLDIRVHRNPAGKTQVFLNEDDEPSFEKQYSELPDRNRPPSLNTSLGYIRFGHIDPRAFSHSEWDYIRYKVHNARNDLKTLPHSVFNASHRVSSSEALYDDQPDLIKVYSDTEDTIVLSSKMIGASRVLDVLSEDENTSYDFEFNDQTQVITLVGGSTFPEKRTPVKIRYITNNPYGHKYLQEQDPVTKLNEGTPPFALSLQKVLSREDDDIDPDADLFNGVSETSYSGDGQFRYTFTVNDDALYEDLDLRSVDIRGEKSLLSPACDDQGFTALIFEDWDETEDTYTMPDQGDVKCIYNSLIADDPSSLLDDGTCVDILYPNLEIDFQWSETDLYKNSLDDEVFDGELTEIEGLLLDVGDSHLDNSDDTLDTYSESSPTPVLFETA